MSDFLTENRYYPSEQTLGQALVRLKEKHPRESYFLSTKCGRYRPIDGPAMFDYSIPKLTHSVSESLRRLQVSYLDLILLHDVEFVAEPIGLSLAGGQPTDALLHPELYGLGQEDAGKVHGEGDAAILTAIEYLFTLKDIGSVRYVGLSGYPLPVLLRIAILVKERLNRPLDVVLSYAHHTLLSFPQDGQATNLQQFLPSFRTRAGVDQLINASPLAMGLFRNCGPPPWHPAPAAMKTAVAKAVALLPSGVEIADPALRFGLKPIEGVEGELIPTIVGLSNAQEAHASIANFEKANLASLAGEADVATVLDSIQRSGQGGLTWPSELQAEADRVRAPSASQ